MKSDKPTLEERVQITMEEFLVELISLMQKRRVGEVQVKARVTEGGIQFIKVISNNEKKC